MFCFCQLSFVCLLHYYLILICLTPAEPAFFAKRSGAKKVRVHAFVGFIKNGTATRMINNVTATKTIKNSFLKPDRISISVNIYRFIDFQFKTIWIVADTRNISDDVQCIAPIICWNCSNPCSPKCVKMPVGTTYINEINANIEVIGLLFLFLVLLFILIFRNVFLYPTAELSRPLKIRLPADPWPSSANALYVKGWRVIGSAWAIWYYIKGPPVQENILLFSFCTLKKL